MAAPAGPDGVSLVARAATSLLDPQGRALAAAVQWWPLDGLDGGWPVAVLGQGPPLLLLHGFDSCHQEFRRLAPLLANDHRLFIPDLFGFGFGPRPRSGDYSPAGVLRHLEALLVAIAEREGDRPLGLIGASMGGSVAVELARRQPQRIARLLLLAPAGLTGRPMPLPPLLDGLGVRFLAQPGVRRGLCRSAFADPDSAVGEPELQIASLHLATPGWADSLRRFARSGGFAGCGEPLPSQPLEVLWGENDRILRPPQKRAALALLGSRLQELPACGHLPHIDQPQQVAQVWRQGLATWRASDPGLHRADEPTGTGQANALSEAPPGDGLKGQTFDPASAAESDRSQAGPVAAKAPRQPAPGPAAALSTAAGASPGSALRPAEPAPQALLQALEGLAGMQPGRRRLVVLMGQLGDFDSLEYAQALAGALPALDAAGIRLQAIGIGAAAGRERFCRFTGFPGERLAVVAEPQLHRALGLHPGLQGVGGPWPALLLMCAGIGSPGTLAEVLRGYLGDRRAAARLAAGSSLQVGSLPPLPASLFALLGEGYQRPFELASVRLRNMVEVLGRWRTYVPDDAWITQRGGTFLLDADDALLYVWRDPGLLGFSATMHRPLAFLDPFLGDAAPAA